MSVITCQGTKGNNADSHTNAHTQGIVCAEGAVHADEGSSVHGWRADPVTGMPFPSQRDNAGWRPITGSAVEPQDFILRWLHRCLVTTMKHGEQQPLSAQGATWESLPSGKGTRASPGAQKSLQEKSSNPLHFPTQTNSTCQMQVQLVDHPLTTGSLHGNF